MPVRARNEPLAVLLDSVVEGARPQCPCFRTPSRPVTCGDAAGCRRDTPLSARTLGPARARPGSEPLLRLESSLHPLLATDNVSEYSACMALRPSRHAFWSEFSPC
jgi:hypothetical protein